MLGVENGIVLCNQPALRLDVVDPRSKGRRRMNEQVLCTQAEGFRLPLMAAEPFRKVLRPADVKRNIGSVLQLAEHVDRIDPRWLCVDAVDLETVVRDDAINSIDRRRRARRARLNRARKSCRRSKTQTSGPKTSRSEEICHFLLPYPRGGNGSVP